MRFASPQLQGTLSGSFDVEWVADLHYNGRRTLARLPITDPQMGEDADADIQQSGQVTVVWADEFATSLSPAAVTDPLAPFGAQLHIFTIIHAGPFTETVEYGWYQITDVPAARDEHMQFQGRQITTGSTVQLELKELLAGPGFETFDVPSAPAQLDSAWTEIGRIAGLPLLQSIADAPIPRSIMHNENKLTALYELMDVVLDATPHMTADGTLSARPHTWPAPALALTRAEHLIDVGSMMTAEDVYNRVVVRATGDDRLPIRDVAEITAGPLRVRNPDGTASPFRARTLYLSSEYVTTKSSARTWAASTLAQVSTPRSQVLPITMTFHPLLERGDVVTIERATRTLLGRVRTISRTKAATQDVTVEIAGEV